MAAKEGKSQSLKLVATKDDVTDLLLSLMIRENKNNEFS